MSQNNPTVSVIMPCYNQGHFLAEAVGSVLAQTYKSFELVIINDGSTDAATLDILKQYQHPGIQVLHTENRGPAAARNTGIQQARGKYILPLDSDDRIAPTYLERAVDLLDRDAGIGIVYSQAELFGTKTGKCDLPGYSFPAILLGNMVFNSSCFRKSDWEKVGGYNENMVYGWEDYDFWLSIIELGRDVVQIPEVLYFYRQVPDSRSDRLTEERQIISYAQIFHNHPQLYGDNIAVLFQHIFDLRKDVHSTHSRLHTCLEDLETTHTKLGQTRLEVAQAIVKLERYQQIITAMRSSKFWQLRQNWVNFKRRLGLNVNDIVDDDLS